MAKKKAKKKARRPAKKAAPKIDGMNPKDVENLVRAIRQVWGWSHVRKLAINRAKLPVEVGHDPLYRCEDCKRTVPKVYADHIEPLGAFGPGYIERMFCASSGLLATCKKCHQVKTNAENALRRMLAVE